MQASTIFQQLANIITISRIMGVGLIFWLTPYTDNFIQLIAVLIYTIICVTDFLDGWVARKFKIVSDLGKILDPLADKILVLVFLPLLEMHVITSFPVFIILAREFAIMALRVIAAKQGTIVPASQAGKLKTIITLPICGILFGRVPVDTVELPWFLIPIEYLRLWVMSWPQWLVDGLVWAVVVVTVWSFLDYFRHFIWQQTVKKHQGNHEKAKKSLLALIPNAFSFANLGCGLVASVLVWMDHMNMVAFLVLLAMIFDAIDGPLARRFQTDSKIGAKLDSKADIISFGVAPGLAIANMVQLPVTWGSWILGLGFYICVYYRLKRFNNRGHASFFEGLPSPVGAAALMIGTLTPWFNTPLTIALLAIIISGLMISKIPYPHNYMVGQLFFLRHLRRATGICLFSTMCGLIFSVCSGITPTYFLWMYQALFATTVLYLFSPLYYLGFKSQR